MKLSRDFFDRDVLSVAPDLLGKRLVTQLDGETRSLIITETEAYRGEDDTACHASKGRTKRTELLYRDSGTLYIYLCYGMHWLFNIVTGGKDNPQAVLIRACEGKFNGPAKLTKFLKITGELNGESIFDNPKIWIEDTDLPCEYLTDKRVGINYATPYYRDIDWRFILKTDQSPAL
ncbi:MAG: DNA-3-methyladenine glycosylase [Ruminococcus sp.]|nr:DNA-3-methyladenine glycosylase [Ruminococcus sp.]